ncbi:acyl-CoA carboxylase epsilon subunit [Streptomyces phaeoluteigriseus]
MAAEDNSTVDVSRLVTAHSWRITSGSPTAEEVAAVAVALSAVLATRAVRETDSGSRDGARWTPFSARRRTATSWAADPRPGWRGAA